MGDDVVTELRIYCICGQKMKVSESMFGLPGKCVACRQKIRVPNREEIPPGATEVHLKDHPEFLRKTSAPAAPAPESGGAVSAPVEEAEVVTLGESSEAVSVAILDILEPLRCLCSLDYKIRRQLESLSKGEAEVGEDRVSLEGYLARVRTARADLDEQLRQRLMEVAIELASTQEKIIQTGLSARIGEIEFATFRDTIDRLRRRRDHLERIQQDLRGWVTVNDPHVAGGFTNVSLDSIPGEGFQVLLPPEPVDPRSLFDQHLEGLRDALQRRERAELRLSETARLKAEGTMSPLVLADCRADCEAEKHRAEAEVTFRRKRLDRHGNDCAADIQALQACLEQARKRLRAGTLDKARFAAMERDILRMQRDSARVHSLVARALLASTAEDVPHPSGSLLKRMGRPVPHTRLVIGADSWVAWGSALTLLVSVFLPAIGTFSPVQAYQNMASQGTVVHWVMVLPILIGALLAVSAALPTRTARGLAYAVLWLTLACLGIFLIHESQYGLNPMAVRFRQGHAWYLRPGVVFPSLADLGILAAAALALAPVKRVRAVLPAAVGACLVFGLGVSSDLGGRYVARPGMTVAWHERPEADRSQERAADRRAYDVVVTVGNYGGRTLLLGTLPTDARNAFTYAIERQSATDYWQDANGVGRNELRTLLPAAEAVFQHVFAPGTYRVRLVAGTGLNAAMESFSLSEFEPAASQAPEPAPEPRGSAASEEPAENAPAAAAATPAPKPAVNAQTRGVEVELRGAVNLAKRGSRFSVVVYPPDAPARYLDLAIGDMVYDPWTVAEFNAERQAVTITDGERMLILNRGQRVPLG